MRSGVNVVVCERFYHCANATYGHSICHATKLLVAKTIDERVKQTKEQSFNNNKYLLIKNTNAKLHLYEVLLYLV